MQAHAFNQMCDHSNSKNITPVFLGKTSMDKRDIKVDERMDFSKGVNFIDKTSLMDAAFIMKNSEMVIGVDNGLLH